LIRTACIAIAAATLAACATHRPAPPPVPLPAPPTADAAAPTPFKPDPRTVFVQTALDMLGEPYRYGGAERGGFDCSGLVEYAARRAGVVVPRTAQEQLKTGAPVARMSLEAGDLVFLHLAGKDLHVGIAIDPVRFVHAPSSGGRVRIDSLDAAPYRRGYFAARRISFPP
jgi:cell wall-associated NlpC family hydrolase